MKRHILLTALATLALTSACSTEVTFDTGSGGSGTDGSGAGATTGTGGSGDVCTNFVDRDPISDIEIRITNGTMVPLFLPADCGFFRLDIAAFDSNDELRYTRQPDGCLSTCEDLQNDGPIACGECECQDDGVCYGRNEGDTYVATSIATLGLESSIDLTFL